MASVREISIPSTDPSVPPVRALALFLGGIRSDSSKDDKSRARDLLVMFAFSIKFHLMMFYFAADNFDSAFEFGIYIIDNFSEQLRYLSGNQQRKFRVMMITMRKKLGKKFVKCPDVVPQVVDNLRTQMHVACETYVECAKKIGPMSIFGTDLNLDDANTIIKKLSPFEELTNILTNKLCEAVYGFNTEEYKSMITYFVFVTHRIRCLKDELIRANETLIMQNLVRLVISVQQVYYA